MLSFRYVKSYLTQKISKQTIGYVTILGAAILASLLDIVGKPLVDSQYSEQNVEMNPIFLSLCIYVVIGLFFTPLAKRSSSSADFTKRNLIIMCGIGIAEVLAITSNFFGLALTSATNASIISNSEIVFGIFIALAIFREKIYKAEIGPFLMIVVGAMIIPIAHDMMRYDFILSEIMIGDLLIMAGAIFYAIDMNISKLVSNKISPVRISQISAFAGMVFAFLLVVSMGVSWDVSWYDLPGILFLGVFSTGISSLLFVISLRLIGPVRAILIYCTANAFEMVFAWVILGELLETIHVMSLIIAVYGVMLLRHKIS